MYRNLDFLIILLYHQQEIRLTEDSQLLLSAFVTMAHCHKATKVGGGTK